MITTLAKPVRGIFALKQQAAPVAQASVDLFGYQPWSSPSFTDEEVFRMTGTLPADRIEHLVDTADALRQCEDIDGNIAEAYGQFPPEDFLSDVMQALVGVCNMLKQGSASRQALNNALAMMEDQLQTQFYATEYATSELDKALRTLVKAGVAQDRSKAPAAQRRTKPLA